MNELTEKEIISTAMKLLNERSLKAQKAKPDYSKEMARRGALGLKSRYAKKK